MKGAASIHHSEACCTGYYALEQAVDLVASGKYDCVLSGCVEFGDSLAVPNHPYKREKMTMDKFLQTTAWIYDRAYTRSLMAGQKLIYDDAAEWYKRTRGITDEQMDDTLNWMCINNRKNASKNPLATERKTYEEYAKEAGFDNVMDYMRSPYNPKMGDFLRAAGLELKCDGAAAVVVCATDMVDRFMGNRSHKPIEVLGIGCARARKMGENIVKAIQTPVEERTWLGDPDDGICPRCHSSLIYRGDKHWDGIEFPFECAVCGAGGDLLRQDDGSFKFVLAENGLIRDRNKNEARAEHLNEIVQTRSDYLQHREELSEIRKKYREMEFPTIPVTKS